MKLIYFIFYLSILSCCIIYPKKERSDFLNSISIGSLKGIEFKSHVSRPQYKFDGLKEYNCLSDQGEYVDHLTNVSSNLDYITFFCQSYSKYIPYIENIFRGKFSFTSQKEFNDIKILWGDAVYQTSPQVYIIQKDNPITETVIFHELGHRLSFILAQDLKIPIDTGDFITTGIIDYLAASVANNPLIGEGFVPPIFVRDITKVKTYPKDLSYYKDLSEKFNSTYSKYFENKKHHQKFYELFVELSRKNKNTVEGHTSGMIISSALWALRKKLGAKKMDQVVADALMRLKNLTQFRSQYLKKLSALDVKQKTLQWYDFVISIAIHFKTSEPNLKNCNFTLELFRQRGFDVRDKFTCSLTSSVSIRQKKLTVKSGSGRGT